MMPIGLTYKNFIPDKFTGKIHAELMIVHMCLECGEISTNRIAGDDNPNSVATIYKKSLNLTIEMRTILNEKKLSLLKKPDEENVLRCLFGNNFQQYVDFKLTPLNRFCLSGVFHLCNIIDNYQINMHILRKFGIKNSIS